MRTFNYFYENPEHFKTFLDGIGLDRSKQVLVRIHSTKHSMQTIVPVAENVKKELDKAVIIGCSTTVVICEGKTYDDACLISITETETCELRLGMFSCMNEDKTEKDGEELCREVSDGLIKGDKGLFLTFFPLSYYKTSKFVKSMNREHKHLVMAGGVSYMTAEVYHEAENFAYVLAGAEASADCMAGVMMVSDELHIYENVVNGVEGVGRSYEVTKVHEHFVDEIEGEDAAVWYERMLGEEQLKKNPNLAGIFPLLCEGTRQSYNVVYEPYDTLPEPWISQKKNRINLFSEISEGMHFSLGYFDPQKIVDQLNDVYEDLRNEPVEVLFCYDCLARMWMLHDCATWEIEQFYTTNMSGAMLAGEIGHVDGKNMYANSTFVIAGISEQDDAHVTLKEKELQNVSALQYDNVQMINYLLTMGNKQLNRQLDEQQNKMKKAMFYNEVLDMDNQTKYLLDCETQDIDKIAVFSLKNKRIIRLFLGRETMENELNRIYKEAGKIPEKDGFYLYSYGEYSLLVGAEHEIDENFFKTCVKKIYTYLNSVGCQNILFSYDCALVLYEKEALQKAEAALQYGTKKKLPIVIYNEMPGHMYDVKEEMHMLQIIRDALAYDRIIPYFQGIYDNREKCINMYESLIRIQDEQGTIYYPDQFLPLAKEYELYEALSVVMVEKVLKMFLNKNIRVTINLNVQDIYDRSMLRMIFQYLVEEKHPENFVFELVESEEVQDYKYIKQFADSIHECGARVAIDDFGSGFSNIMHIIRIDADIIKIDGEIVKEICTDENCREFIEMIHGWCMNQNKEVVAEYVENEDIQKIMEEIGITHSQGYYFSKPKPWE